MITVDTNIIVRKRKGGKKGTPIKGLICIFI